MGTTVVALRYRGLGRIEQKFSKADNGGIGEAFSTTDTIPHLIKGTPLISPIVPSSKAVNDRGYAHWCRAGAWIAHMARGAGHPFVDYQFRPEAALCTFFERQGNYRALTEAFPGDLVVSQSDDIYFPSTDQHTTEPQVFLALITKDQPQPAHESRTRWREVDQYVRDLVSDELNFVQRPVLPGIGILSDAGWAGYYKGLAEKGVDAWADAGVRVIAFHNPGWVNGRYQGPKDKPGTPPKTGGGVCNIYDYQPTSDVKEPWTDFQKACARREVAFYPWIGQTTWKDAPMVKRIGLNPEYWSLNGPNDTHGPGYGPENMKGNIHNETFRSEFTGTLKKIWQENGYQGFWVDSFQNLFMSQLDWVSGGGNSMQRAWWEWVAEWSREGVDWMAESHSFPGLSCSIEISNWEKDVWTFQHVWKWLRGNAQAAYKPEELDDVLFRTMAAKGWVAPDHSYQTHADFKIPSFKRMAHEYMEALPMMQRSYVLEKRNPLASL